MGQGAEGEAEEAEVEVEVVEEGRKSLTLSKSLGDRMY